MLTYIPTHVNMRKYDLLWLPNIVSLPLPHGFQKAFKLFVADCFSLWQLLLYEYYFFWLHEPLRSDQISRNYTAMIYNMS